MQQFSCRTRRKRLNGVDVGADGRIILKWILEKVWYGDEAVE
jgi:hypothetical protein